MLSSCIFKELSNDTNYIALGPIRWMSVLSQKDKKKFLSCSLFLITGDTDLLYIFAYKSHFKGQKMSLNKGCDLYVGHSYIGSQWASIPGYSGKIIGATYMRVQTICQDTQYVTFKPWYIDARGWKFPF